MENTVILGSTNYRLNANECLNPSFFFFNSTPGFVWGMTLFRIRLPASLTNPPMIGLANTTCHNQHLDLPQSIHDVVSANDEYKRLDLNSFSRVFSISFTK